MRILHEAQGGCDHRTLWELLRKREGQTTQVQTLLSLLLKYGSQFASNRKNRGMGPKCTLTAITKHSSIIRLDKKNQTKTMIAAGTRSFDCSAKQYMDALRSYFEHKALLVLLPPNFYYQHFFCDRMAMVMFLCLSFLGGDLWRSFHLGLGVSSQSQQWRNLAGCRETWEWK